MSTGGTATLSGLTADTCGDAGSGAGAAIFCTAVPCHPAAPPTRRSQAQTARPSMAGGIFTVGTTTLTNVTVSDNKRALLRGHQQRGGSRDADADECDGFGKTAQPSAGCVLYRFGRRDTDERDGFGKQRDLNRRCIEKTGAPRRSRNSIVLGNSARTETEVRVFWGPSPRATASPTGDVADVFATIDPATGGGLARGQRRARCGPSL